MCKLYSFWGDLLWVPGMIRSRRDLRISHDLVGRLIYILCFLSKLYAVVSKILLISLWWESFPFERKDDVVLEYMPYVREISELLLMFSDAWFLFSSTGQNQFLHKFEIFIN